MSSHKKKLKFAKLTTIFVSKQFFAFFMGHKSKKEKISKTHILNNQPNYENVVLLFNPMHNCIILWTFDIICVDKFYNRKCRRKNNTPNFDHLSFFHIFLLFTQSISRSACFHFIVAFRNFVVVYDVFGSTKPYLSAL